MREVTLMGKPCKIRFNMAAQFIFEKMTGKSFSEFNPSLTSDSISLAVSCILAADKSSDITIMGLAEGVSLAEMNKLMEAVNEEINEWLLPPASMPEEKEDKDEKNV